MLDGSLAGPPEGPGDVADTEVDAAVYPGDDQCIPVEFVSMEQVKQDAAGTAYLSVVVPCLLDGFILTDPEGMTMMAGLPVRGSMALQNSGYFIRGFYPVEMGIESGSLYRKFARRELIHAGETKGCLKRLGLPVRVTPW